MPGLRVADYASTGDRAFLTRDPRVSYGLVFTRYSGELNPPSLGPQITAAMRPQLSAGSTVAVTGMNELTSGGQAREGFGVLAETLLAGTAALAVLAFVFGSAAGRSIAYSGVTVAIGLLSLIVLPVPALRSIGIGGMLVPAVSVAVSLTLLPALLATAGQRIDWPRRRRPAAASRAWTAWARLVVRPRARRRARRGARLGRGPRASWHRSRPARPAAGGTARNAHRNRAPPARPGVAGPRWSASSPPPSRPRRRAAHPRARPHGRTRARLR
jgi:hypothetical protein